MTHVQISQEDQQQIQIVLIRMNLLDVDVKKLLAALAICYSQPTCTNHVSLAEAILGSKSDLPQIKKVLAEMQELSSKGAWALSQQILQTLLPQTRSRPRSGDDHEAYLPAIRPTANADDHFVKREGVISTNDFEYP